MQYCGKSFSIYEAMETKVWSLQYANEIIGVSKTALLLRWDWAAVQEEIHDVRSCKIVGLKAG